MIPDNSAISNLIFTYAELLDAGDLEGLGKLFSHGEFSGMHGWTIQGPRGGNRELPRGIFESTDDGLPWQKASDDQSSD